MELNSLVTGFDALPQEVQAEMVRGKETERLLRRQMAEEIGEDNEVSREERLMLLQKYGLMAPRINRGVTKPSWMEVSVWKRKLNEFYQITKGLVSQEVRRPNPRRYVRAGAVKGTVTTRQLMEPQRRLERGLNSPQNRNNSKRSFAGTPRERFAN